MHNIWAVPVLKLAAATTIAFGLVLALVNVPPLAGPGILFTDLVIWPLDGLQRMDGIEARLYAAVLGGVMVGWGLMIWLVVGKLLPKDPALARQMILVSSVTWFVVDSTGSALSGAALNIVPNIGFLALFVIPCLALPKQR